MERTTARTWLHRVLEEPPPGLTILLGLIFFAASVSRRPGTLVRPQFWAEDGALFYQQAHALGFLPTVVIPYAGYLQALPRLTAGLSLLFPLALAPLLFNLVALLTQSLPPIFLCSARMKNIGPLSVRVLLAFLCLGVPNVPRVMGSLTNAQWHLAVLCFMILIASPPRSVWAAVFDVTALSIGVVTGPFALFLLPVAFIVALRRRDVWTTRRAGIVCLGALAISITLLLSARPNTLTDLGASVHAFCRILTFQIFLPVFRGINDIYRYVQYPAWLPIITYGVTAVGLAGLAYVLVRGSMEVRCFILFAALVLGASLASPLASSREPQWVSLQRPEAPSRYWLIPELAVAAAVVSLAVTAANRPVRALGAGLVCVMLVVDIAYWRLPDFPNLHFEKYVAAFEALPVGETIRIPILPPNWHFEITKTERD